MTAYEGQCHCGAIRMTYTSDIPVEAWSVRACQCTFCRLHGARSTSDPNGEVRFVVRDEEAVSRYAFGLRTAEFLLCRVCGGYLAAVMAPDGRRFATINANALRGLAALPETAPVTYDAETSEARIARRIARWTPVSGALEPRPSSS